MEYYLFSWLDWLLLVSLLCGTVISLILNKGIKGLVLPTAKIMLLCITISLAFGLLIWDGFPLSICFKFIVLAYWTLVLYGAKIYGKSGAINSLHSLWALPKTLRLLLTEKFDN